MTEISFSSEKYVKGDKILRELIETVKHCQQRFGGKKEIATESDEIVASLCGIWEDVICYGIKSQNSTSSLLRNVQEIVYGSNDFILWEFFQLHMTKHEQERFNSLENVSTNRGKLRALIRASLNERSLERYLYMWLGDSSLNQFYESWALMLNTEATNLLPSMAAGLASILFAIAIDTASIDILTSFKKEPVIFAPAPVGPKKKTIPVKRHILSSDESESVNSGSLSSDSNFDKDLNLSNDEGAMPSPFPLINDNINNDTLTFHENFIDLILEDPIIPDNGSTKLISEASEISSIIESTSSLSCETDNRNLEEKLTEALERCAFLEGRVAELNLENRRLHRLLGVDYNNTQHYSIAIPRAVLVNSERKKFHVYQIRISFKQPNDDWLVEKRYSEFYKLHQDIKRKNEFIRALDFPPKKFGRMNSTFLEERRQRLQIYLRHLLALLPETSSCKTRDELQVAFPFFIE